MGGQRKEGSAVEERVSEEVFGEAEVHDILHIDHERRDARHE